MKVLIINQAFYPDVVATAQKSADLALCLVEAGHEVTVLASSRAYDQPERRFAAREDWRGVQIVRTAGTGFGRQEHSLARVVAFDPESAAAEKVLLKYEWRSTLCRQGIVRCETSRPPRNRLWDDGEFAPLPPGRS